MSFKLTVYALDEFKWNENELRLAWLMVAIGEWSNDDGVSFHGIEDLARRCRVSKEHTIAMIQKLEGRGELFVARPKVRGRGRHNTYIMIGSRTPEEILAVFEKYGVFHRFDAQAEITAIFEKRGQDVGQRLTRENFTPEVELEMLLVWGRKVFANFDPVRFEEIQKQLERSKWRLSDAQLEIACAIVYATNWEIPHDDQKRKTWKAGINTMLERWRGDKVHIARLVSAAFAKLKQSQKEKTAKGESFEIPSNPQTLLKTMDAIHERIRAAEQEKSRDIFNTGGGDDEKVDIQRLWSDPDYAATFFSVRKKS